MPEVWSIASVISGDGRITLVATGDAAEAGDPAQPGVWWLSQITAGQVGWSGDWRSAGLPAPGLRSGRPRIAAARNSDGCPAVAVCGVDNAIWYAWQEKPDGPWSAWRTLDRPPPASAFTHPSDPTLVQHGDGRLAVFVTVAGEVWTRRQEEQRDPESWTSWTSVGGEVPVLADSSARPTVAQQDDVRLEVLATSGENLRHILETEIGGPWSHWRRIGCTKGPGQPLVTLDDERHLVTVVVDALGHLRRNVQLTPGGPWGGWHGIQPPQPGTFEPLGMALASHADARPVFLAPYLDAAGQGQVWLVERVPPAADDWRSRTLGPHPLPELAAFATRIEDPVLTVDASGRLIAAFRVTGSANIYWLRQEEVNGDVWLEGVLRAAPPPP